MATSVGNRDGGSALQAPLAHIERMPPRGTVRLGSVASVSCWVDLGSDEHPHRGTVFRVTDRTGRSLGLSVLGANVTTHQSSFRQPSFWYQSGTSSGWKDCGRVGDGVRALAVHDGSLYVATYDGSAGGTGRVLRYLREAEWQDCGSPGPTNAVASLAVYRDQLYAGTARFHGRGTAMPESPNRTGAAGVYRLTPGGRWESQGALGDEDGVGAMAVYRDRLWAVAAHGEGLYVFDGVGWRLRSSPGRRLTALAVVDDQLLGAGNEGGGIVPWLGDVGGGVFRYDESEDCWSSMGMQPVTSQVYSIAGYRGSTYVSTWPQGRVYRHAGGQHWDDCGRLGTEIEVMGLIEYNGSLYAGTLPSASIYRYEGSAGWVSTGNVDDTPDQRYRRAWGMAVFQGRLFCGSTPKGHVYSLVEGLNATADRDPGSGRHHFAGVLDGQQVALYVDGALAGVQRWHGPTPPEPAGAAAFEGPIACEFPGEVTGLRVYDRALTADEVRGLTA